MTGNIHTRMIYRKRCVLVSYLLRSTMRLLARFSTTSDRSRNSIHFISCALGVMLQINATEKLPRTQSQPPDVIELVFDRLFGFEQQQRIAELSVFVQRNYQRQRSH